MCLLLSPFLGFSPTIPWVSNRSRAQTSVSPLATDPQLWRSPSTRVLPGQVTSTSSPGGRRRSPQLIPPLLPPSLLWDWKGNRVRGQITSTRRTVWVDLHMSTPPSTQRDMVYFFSFPYLIFVSSCLVRVIETTVEGP